jgi:hypothetical protein
MATMEELAKALDTKAMVEELRDLLMSADSAINPGDRDGISLDKWNERLKITTQDIRRGVARCNAFLNPPR